MKHFLYVMWNGALELVPVTAIVLLLSAPALLSAALNDERFLKIYFLGLPIAALCIFVYLSGIERIERKRFK